MCNAKEKEKGEIKSLIGLKLLLCVAYFTTRKVLLLLCNFIENERRHNVWGGYVLSTHERTEGYW